MNKTIIVNISVKNKGSWANTGDASLDIDIPEELIPSLDLGSTVTGLIVAALAENVNKIESEEGES